MNTVSILVKSPIVHPNICRVELSDEIPHTQDGWVLYSTVTTPDADKVYDSLAKLLNTTPATNKNTDGSFVIPVSALDKWMVDYAKGYMLDENRKFLHARDTKYAKHITC